MKQSDVQSDVQFDVQSEVQSEVQSQIAANLVVLTIFENLSVGRSGPYFMVL